MTRAATGIGIVVFGFDWMNSRVILGSWKISAPLYVPLRNVVVNFLLLGGGWTSGLATRAMVCHSERSEEARSSR